MNEKKKQLIVAVFAAVASVIVSYVACALGVPVENVPGSGAGNCAAPAQICGEICFFDAVTPRVKTFDPQCGCSFFSTRTDRIVSAGGLRI